MGPFQIGNDNVSGDTYRNLLIRKMFPRFKSSGSDYVFQRDGFEPSISTIARAYSNRKSHKNWIGKQGPQDWPDRSPDLGTRDFSCRAVLNQSCMPFLYMIWKGYEG